MRRPRCSSTCSREDLEARIAAKLNDPVCDPHGDPIPTREGEIVEPPTQRLDELEPGQRGRLVRVSDSDPEMLRYLTSLAIGAQRRVRGGRAPPVRGTGRRELRRDAPRARPPAGPCHARRAPPVTSDAAGGGDHGGRGARRARPSRPEPPQAPAPPRPRPRRASAPRSRLRRRGRLRRPGQLRHEHRRRVGVRLPAALGDPHGEPAGDADPEPVGQGRHGDGAQPPRALPLGVPQAGHLRALDPGRAHRHGHRPRRVHRGGDRAQPAVRHPAASPAGLITAVVAFALLGLQTRGHRRFEIVIAGMLGVDPASASSTTRSSSTTTRSGIAEGFIPGFEGTDSILLATGILGATVMPHVIYLHSALMQRRIPARGRRRAPARSCASSASTSPRHGHRRRREHGDADHRRVALPRERAGGHRLDRGRARGLREPARPGRGARLRARAAGLRLRVLERRHLRGPGRHAGVHQPLDPARPAPRPSRWRPR